MTDADICLELARAIGNTRPPERGHFDPIHSGADFDSVLMWLRLSDVQSVSEILGLVELHTGKEERARTDTEFRRAVCEAIVEVVG